MNKLGHKPKSHVWIVRQTEHFAFYYHRKSYAQRTIEKIVSRAEETFAKGVEWFGLQYEGPKPQIYLGDWLERSNYERWTSLGSSLLAEDKPIIWQFASPAHPAVELERAIIELLARASTTSRSRYAPELLNALALLIVCNDADDSNAYNLEKKMYERHVLQRLPPYLFQAEDNAAAPEAISAETSFLLFLQNVYGRTSFRRFTKEMLTGDPEAVAKATYAKSLQALEKEWLDALKRRFQTTSGIWSMLGQSYPFIKPHWTSLVELLVYMTFDLLFSLTIPLSIKYLYDNVIISKNYNGLAAWLMVVLALSLLGSYVSFRRLVVGAFMGEFILRDLRRAVFDHLQQLPLSFYARSNTGEILSCITNDTDKVQMALGQYLPDLVFQVISLIAFLAVLLYLNYTLGLLILIGLPLFTFIHLRYTSRLRVAERSHAEQVSQMTSFLQEIFSAQMVVKTFSLENKARASFRHLTDRFVQSSLMLNRYFAQMVSTSSMVNLCLRMLVLTSGALIVIRQRMSLGDLIAFIAMLTQVLYQITAITTKYPRLQTTVGAFDRLQELLSSDTTETEAIHGIDLPKLKKEIRLENVTFRYSDGEPALRNISLKVDAGTNIAVVGPSGSGKSTLINLLLRLYEPSEGQISFDGHNLRDINVMSLRRQIAIVPQDTFLFNISILDNIRIGNEAATRAEIMKAAQEALAHEFIEATKEGYETVIGERGICLSGGQRQRLAIARAIVRNPSILICDEATSALDSATEADILKTLARTNLDRTTITITHRFTAVSHCAVIYVLDQGQLVEQGTHEELINAGGLYQHLYEKQVVDSGRAISSWGLEVARLRTVPMFSDLDDKTLAAFAELAMMERYTIGEDIVRQGEISNTLYIVTAGKVEVIIEHEGVERRVNILNAGDYFGETSLITAEPRSATVRAMAPTQVYTISKRNFFMLIEQEPSIKKALSMIISDRRAPLIDLAGVDVTRTLSMT
jgi:ATP-binding cassette subfamily B protein